MFRVGLLQTLLYMELYDLRTRQTYEIIRGRHKVKIKVKVKVKSSRRTGHEDPEG